MKKILIISASAAFLIIAVSVAYYFVIVLPGKKSTESPQQGTVEGVTEEKIEEKEPSATPEPTFSLTPPPSATSSAEEASENEVICKAKRDTLSSTLKAMWNDVLLRYDDPDLSAALEEYKDNMDNCLIACPPRFYLYCLEHDGDMTEVNRESLCPECVLSN